ncbi:MAG: TonB-dependent receptor, partial [Pseudomonadales bacterium]
QDLHANYGSRSGNFGWLVETVQRNSDGFKHIDRSNRDAGLDLEDYLVKLAWEGEHQQLLFKAQRSEEVSNETYLGLTDADFNQNPNRRYGLSSIDQMNNEHDGYSLTYNLMLDESTTLTAMAYHNEFSRDWFKLGGGSAIIDAANAGDSNAQAILDGSADTSGLGYKHNNRSYESSGVELNLTTAIGTHQLEVGGRIHEDEMDRFQPVEIYDQVN